jgi:hypothetical protein
MTDRLFCVCSKPTDLLHLASLLMTVRSLAPVRPAANFAREFGGAERRPSRICLFWQGAR